MTRVLTVLWLALVWVLLWGSFTPANVLGGLAVAGVVVVLFPLGGDHGARLRPLALASFLGWFAVELVKANLTVAAQLVRPRLALRQGIVEIPLRTTSPIVASVVADAISLTPGTLTVDVRPARFGTEVAVGEVVARRDERSTATTAAWAAIDDDHIDDDRTDEDRTEPAEPPAAVLYVHCLVIDSADQVRQDGWDLEARVVRAIGGDHDRAVLAAEGDAGDGATGAAS